MNNEIYLIQQLTDVDLDEILYSDYFVYYASNDLEDVEEKIKSNWSDLNETIYPYVILKTITLNQVVATQKPFRIFRYVLTEDRYKEITIKKEDLKYVSNENQQRVRN